VDKGRAIEEALASEIPNIDLARTIKRRGKFLKLRSDHKLLIFYAFGISVLIGLAIAIQVALPLGAPRPQAGGSDPQSKPSKTSCAEAGRANTQLRPAAEACPASPCCGVIREGPINK
jgi:hypothetical protein